jgi:hypothetical protein
VENILDLGGGNGRGQDPAMEAGRGSERGTAKRPGILDTTQAQEAALKNILGGHTEWSAEPRFEPEPVKESSEKLDA